MDEIRKFHFQQDYLGCVDDEANIANKCDARRQVFSDNISSSLSRWLDRLKSTMMTAEYMIKTTTLLKIQRELCMFSSLPDLIGIDMDETRMFHFQQDYLGCVDDEANIVKKCDARRQVTSDDISYSLSRWLDRLMSVMMTPAVYAIIVPTVFVSKNTLYCYVEQNKLGRYEMFARCCNVCCQCTSALGSAKSTLSCACLLPLPPSSSSRGRQSRRRSASRGTRRTKSCTPSLSCCRLPYKHVQSTYL